MELKKKLLVLVLMGTSIFSSCKFTEAEIQSSDKNSLQPVQKENIPPLEFYRKGNPELGRAKFIQWDCVKCHQVKTDPVLPEPIEDVNAPMLSASSQNKTPEELAKQILTPAHNQLAEMPITEISEGHPPVMPSYQGKISTQDLIDIVTYLRTSQTVELENEF